MDDDLRYRLFTAPIRLKAWDLVLVEPYHEPATVLHPMEPGTYGFVVLDADKD